MSAYLVWFLIGLGFILAELAVPGFILIFFGVGCWVTSAVLFFTPLSLSTQFAIFTLATLASLFGLRKYLRRALKGDTTDQESEKIDKSDLGQSAVVVTEIRTGKPGEIKYRGSYWKAVSSRTIPVDEAVTIVGHPENDSQTFEVEPVSPGKEM